MKISDLETSPITDVKSLYAVSFYASNEKMSHSRQIYNSLDFLGDVGGLLDGLKLIFSSLLGLAYHGQHMSELSSKLFFKRPSHRGRKKPEPHRTPSSLPAESRQDQLYTVMQGINQVNSLQPIKAHASSCCQCLAQYWSKRAKKRSKILQKSSKRIASQLDIVKFLHTQLFIDVLIKQLFNPIERHFARHQYKTFVVDTTSSSSSDHSDSEVFKKKKSGSLNDFRESMSLSLTRMLDTGDSTRILALSDGVFKHKRKDKLQMPQATDSNDMLQYSL